MLQTVLYDAHLRSSGKLVEFAGYMLPINYGSQIEEHNAVRTSAGMFDVSHMALYDIEGADADKFLSFILSNDVAKLVPGKAFYSLYLNETGGIIDDLIVYKRADNKYRIVSNAGTRDKDLAWVKLQAQAYAVTICEYSNYAILAVQGPQAIAKVQTVVKDLAIDQLKSFEFVENSEYFIATTGYTGELGCEIIVLDSNIANNLWNSLLGLGVSPAGLGARDTLRLEAGMNLYGQDMDDSISPTQCNTGFAVDIKTSPERDFIGKKAYLQARETNQYSQVGIILEGRGVLRSHYKLFANGVEVGEVTSGTFSPTLGQSVAMVRLNKQYVNSTEVHVDIRGNLNKVKIVKLPFVKQGKILV